MRHQMARLIDDARRVDRVGAACGPTPLMERLAGEIIAFAHVATAIHLAATARCVAVNDELLDECDHATVATGGAA